MNRKFTYTYEELERKVKELETANERLLEKSLFWESFIDTAKVIVIILDTEGKVVYFNPFMEERSGYKLKEIQGCDWFTTFITDGDRERIYKLFKNALNDNQTNGNINPIIDKNGREIFVEWYDKTLKDKNGNVVGLIAIGHDVTASKREEERYRMLFENSPLGIVIVDTETKKHIDANPAMCNMFGYTKEELLGMNFLEKHPKAYHSLIIDDFEEYSKGKKVESHSIPCLHKNGSLIYADITGCNVFIDGRNHCLAFFKDITKQKQIEAMLQFERDIIQYMVEGVSVVDPKTGTIIYVNPAFERIFGYNSNEMIGINVITLNASSNDQGVFKLNYAKPDEINITLNEKGVWSGEMLNVKKDGTVFCLYSKITTHNHIEYGEVWLGVHEDITNRKEAEEALKQSEKKYRFLIDNLNEGIWVIDKDYYTTFTNHRIAEMLGYTVEEMQGKHLFSFMDEEGVTQANFNLELGKQGLRKQYDFEFLHKKGNKIWTTIETSPIIDDNGNYIGSLAGVIDITERKILEKQLKDREEKLRLITDTISEVFWMTDININKIIYVSNGYESVWGQTIQSLYDNPRPFIDAVHPDDKERILINFLAQKNKQPFSNEYRIIKPDGSVRWIWDRGFPIFEDNGEVNRYAGIAQDITERKQLDYELQEEREKYVSVFNTISESIFIIDGTSKNILDLNKSALRLYGYSKNEILNLKIIDISAEPEKTNFCIQQTLEGKICRISEGLHKKKDETIIAVEISLCSFILKNQKLVCCVIRDITDRKKADEALKESNELRRLITETIDEVFWMIDIYLTKIAYISPKYEQIWGRSCESLYNNPKSFFDAIHDEDKERVITYFREVIANKKPSNSEYRIILPDGSIRWIWDRGYPLQNEANSVSWYIGVSRDITSRKQMEEMLHQAKETADSSNLSKSAFLANMSHEIRTPMNAIIGSSKILLEMPHTHEQRKYLDIINAAGNNLLTIINDILDVSKIEAGKIDLERKDTLLSDIINDVMNILYPSVITKGIELVCEKIDASFPVIKTDPVRLKQVLLNLVNNAVKFTNKGSVAINVSIEKETDTYVTLCFSVNDTGMGIPQDKINQLFKPFSQASKIKIAGTGLGLTISKNIIELMGGTIHVDSKEGSGSKFWFVIPFEKGSTAQLGESIQDSHDEKNTPLNLKILVAEDNLFNQEVIKGLLLNHKVTVVSNGKEAVDILENTSFDVILMDIQMPEMDGITATKMIRDHNSKVLNHNIPIIAMTAYAMKEDRDLCLESGMDGYVSKPVNCQNLNSEFKRVIKLSSLCYSPP